MAVKRRWSVACLSCRKEAGIGPWPRTGDGIIFISRGRTVKPSLRIKILILIGYVVLCTSLLMQGEQPTELVTPHVEAGYEWPVQ